MKTMIIVAEGLEECEALLTYDLLYRAGIEVDLVGLSPEIESSHRLTFLPHRLIDEIDPNDYDCLVLPGGKAGTANLERSDKVQQIIDLFVAREKYIAAICAAPSILVHKGLLKDERFTCYPGFESGLTSTGRKVEKEGRFITGRGLGAAFEFSAEIIRTLLNNEKAEEVLSKICY